MPKGREDSGLDKLDELLGQVAEGGQPLTADEFQQLEARDVDANFWRTLKTRDQVRKNLRSAWSEVDQEKKAFPDLLKEVRLRAGVTVEDAAREAHLEGPETLSRLERGDLSVLDLPDHTVGTLMEAFHLALPVLEKAVGRWLARETMKSGMSAPSARSSTKRGVTVGMLDELANVLVDRDSSKGVVPSRFLSAVRETLVRWGRDDLL